MSLAHAEREQTWLPAPSIPRGSVPSRAEYPCSRPSLVKGSIFAFSPTPHQPAKIPLAARCLPAAPNMRPYLALPCCASALLLAPRFEASMFPISRTYVLEYLVHSIGAISCVFLLTVPQCNSGWVPSSAHINSQARAQTGSLTSGGLPFLVLDPGPCRELGCKFSQLSLHAMHTSSAHTFASFDQPCDIRQAGGRPASRPANINVQPTAGRAPFTRGSPRALQSQVLPVS